MTLERRSHRTRMDPRQITSFSNAAHLQRPLDECVGCAIQLEPIRRVALTGLSNLRRQVTGQHPFGDTVDADFIKIAAERPVERSGEQGAVVNQGGQRLFDLSGLCSEACRLDGGAGFVECQVTGGRVLTLLRPADIATKDGTALW